MLSPSESNTLQDENEQTEIMEPQENAEISRINKLEGVLAKYPHLNLAGRVYDVSPSPHGLGGQSDIFTALYKPEGSDKEVKVSVKRLRFHIISSDAKCEKVRQFISKVNNENHLFIIPKGTRKRIVCLVKTQSPKHPTPRRVLS